MALIIEDGTGVPGADSYATVAEFATRAAAYGWTIPAGEPAREVLLRRAAEAMQVLPWKGSRTYSGYGLAFPRTGVVVDGEILPGDAIPDGIRFGQMALAAEIHADDLSPPETRTGAVTREKVDVLEVQYAEAKATRRAAPERASAVQFADYLATRGLFIPAVRA